MPVNAVTLEVIIGDDQPSVLLAAVVTKFNLDALDDAAR